MSRALSGNASARQVTERAWRFGILCDVARTKGNHARPVHIGHCACGALSRQTRGGAREGGGCWAGGGRSVGRRPDGVREQRGFEQAGGGRTGWRWQEGGEAEEVGGGTGGREWIWDLDLDARGVNGRRRAAISSYQRQNTDPSTLRPLRRRQVRRAQTGAKAARTEAGGGGNERSTGAGALGGRCGEGKDRWHGRLAWPAGGEYAPIWGKGG